MERRHTDSEYHAELALLRERLLFMGAKVEDMITKSFRSLVERNAELARETIAFDSEIDRLEVEIDQQCLKMLARWQPVAIDLRFITTVFKVVTHLERIGDLGETVCKRAIELIESHDPMTAGPALIRLNEAALSMVRDALDAFVAGDAVRAAEVIERDRITDAYYAQCFPELMERMLADPKNIGGATRLQTISKALERIGDQATNIAEMVVFMVDGKHIKHSDGSRDPARASGVIPVAPRR